MIKNAKRITEIKKEIKKVKKKLFTSSKTRTHEPVVKLTDGGFENIYVLYTMIKRNQ